MTEGQNETGSVLLLRVLTLASLVLLSVAALAETSPEAVRYTLAPELSDGAISALRIQVNFRADESGTTQFGWDGGWAGNQTLWQWARDFRVSGAVAVEKVTDGRWRIKAIPGTELTATYKIISAYDHDPTVEDSDQSKPVIRPRWFYAVGRTLFAYPVDRKDAPAIFDWAGASGVGFASDLEHLAGRNRRASRPGVVGDVLQSIVIGGRALRTFPADDASGVRVAMIGNYAFPPEQLDKLARRIISVERDFWDADRGAPFLITVAPIVGSPTARGFNGTGLGDSFALWIDQSTPFDYLKSFLAHEYFHTWNPGQLGAMPKDRAAHPAHFWFSEGFTDYYARALMVRAGLTSPAEFAAQWNEMLVAYARSPARTMPGEQARGAFWDDQTVQALPYQRGAMLAAMWNARLLATSKGVANLDTVLKAQLIAAQSSTQQATVLFRNLAARQGLDISADEDRYLVRGETITLPADIFGFCATIVTERQPSFSLGFDARATANAGNVVAGVDPALSAYAAGLRNGMKILARTEGELGNAFMPYVWLVEDKGRQRTIRYLPQDHDLIPVQQIKLVDTALPTCPSSLSGLQPTK